MVKVNQDVLTFLVIQILHSNLDIHLQNVTMCFRGVGNFEIVKRIVGVGSRLKKDYFQVAKKN